MQHFPILFKSRTSFCFVLFLFFEDDCVGLLFYGNTLRHLGPGYKK